MTNATIWLAIITLVPIIGIYILGVNAAPIFLSLCLGYVLYTFDGHNAANLAHNISAHSSAHLKPTDIIVDLILLLGPALIVFVSQIKSVKGAKHFLNIVPAVFSGLFCALLVVPVLPNDVAAKIAKTFYWGKLAHYQAFIVGLGAAIAIIFFWISSKHPNKKAHHKSKD